MKLPPEYVDDLDHRITVLLTFTVRHHARSFPSQSGDLYRASLEGSAIMLRMLLEFLGVKAETQNPHKLTAVREFSEHDVLLGKHKLTDIKAVEIRKLDSETNQFLARMHDEASKRTAHSAFGKRLPGLCPVELRQATRWVLTEIWERCYAPDAITVHGDLFVQLKDAKWEGIPFRSARA